jgi:hypothetical protein
MILPGHIAAAVLCHRYAAADLPVAMAASLAPDVVDKAVYYGTSLSPSSRLPMHTLWGWFGTTLLVALVGLVCARAATWTYAWFLSYGVHLLCDSGLVGDDLPLLYPLVSYELNSPPFPLAYLLDPATWPWPKLIAEAIVVAWAAWIVWRQSVRGQGSARHTNVARP